MARRAKLSPHTFVRNLIASQLNRGVSPNRVYQSVTEAFPDVNKNRIRQEIAYRRQVSTRVQELNRYISGQTRSLKFLEDCPQGTTMRLRFLVEWTDPQTHQKQSFGQTVNMRADRPPEDWIQMGLNAVRRRAVNNGYVIPSDQSLVRDKTFKISITGADCR